MPVLDLGLFFQQALAASLTVPGGPLCCIKQMQCSMVPVYGGATETKAVIQDGP